MFAFLLRVFSTNPACPGPLLAYSADFLNSRNGTDRARYAVF